MSTTRFALLFGDDIIVDALAIAAAFGDYAHTFCQLLTSSLGPIITEVPFTLDAYDVVYDITFPPNDVRYDGLTSTEDPTPWVIELLDHVKYILAWQPSLKPHAAKSSPAPPGCFIKQGNKEVSVTKPRSYPHQRLGASYGSSHAPAHAHLAPSGVVYGQGVAILEPTLARLLEGLESGYYESTAPGLYMWMSQLRREAGPGVVEDALSKDAMNKVGKLSGSCSPWTCITSRGWGLNI